MDKVVSRPDRRPASVVARTQERVAKPAAVRPVPTRYSLPVLPELDELPKLPISLDVKAHSPLSWRLSAARPKSPDYWLIVTIAGLLMIGLVMVYSASQFSTPGDAGYWFRQQLLWVILGAGALAFTLSIDYQRWHKIALPGLLLGCLLLAVVLLFGISVSGARRWLSLGLLTFQPSELIKLVVVIYFAHWLARRGNRVQSVPDGLVPFAFLLGAIVISIILENDVGTSLVVALTALAMFHSAGARLGHLLAALSFGVVSYLLIVLATGFRRDRFEAFLHPLPPGCGGTASYQVCQGLISLGSGGITGSGLGDGVQKAGYLPNPFTDGIFAITGEELGLFGCMVIILLFAIVAYRGLQIARHANDTFGSLLAGGITCWLIVQAAINIGSVVDLIPYTGVPLPLISYGGSSLITTLAALGILLNISRYTTDPGTEEVPS